MKKYELNINSQIQGLYLSTETIELINIMQCDNIDELHKFVSDCEQLKGLKYDFEDFDNKNLEQLKRKIFEDYKSTLISTEKSVTDRMIVLETSLRHSGVPEKDIARYCQILIDHGLEDVKVTLEKEHPEEYQKMAESNHRFIASERDQIKSVTYEEISQLIPQLENHNTILIGSGRYYDVVNKLNNPNITGLEKYDFYHIERGLDFCEKNGMHARYHTLLDKQTLDGHLAGKDKDTVLRELEAYVKASIDFINDYNKNHTIEGANGERKGVINSVDLFNEIISFDPDYINRWEQEYGIELKELIPVFQYAIDHKPEGVTYVYNEPFLENDDRRQAVIQLIKQMEILSPGLIDTIRDSDAY